MADKDDGLNELFDDSSVDDDDIDEFLKMLDDDSDDLLSDDGTSEDLLKEDSVNKLLQEQEEEEESSFVSADLSSDEDIDAHILDDLDSVGGYREETPSENAGEAASFDNIAEIENILSDISTEDNQEAPVAEKKSLWKRIASAFKKEPSEEELQAKEEKRQAKQKAKEEKRLAAEEEEESAYEEQIQSKKQEKKQEKADAKAAAKEEARQKAEADKAAKAAAKAEKKAQAEKKKEEKAAAKEAKRGPIPKSQFVPIKPVIVFVIIGIALSVVLIFGSKNLFYVTNVKDAREQFIHQDYEEAYQNMLGLEVQAKDEEFYNQVTVVNVLDNKLENYRSYKEIQQYDEALDSLLGGVRKYNEYADKAEQLGLMAEFRTIYDEIIAHLEEDFGLSIGKANQMLDLSEQEYNNRITSIAREAAIRDGVISEEDVVNFTQAEQQGD